jgi:hypothetical protein
MSYGTIDEPKEDAKGFCVVLVAFLSDDPFCGGL